MRAVLFLVLLAACGNKSEPGVPTKVGPSSGAHDARLADAAAAPGDPCSPEALGLANVTPLAAWDPPAGCEPKGDVPRVLRSDADLAEQVECSGARATVDFTRHAIVMVPRVLTPSGLGFRAYDDGTTITVVARFRDPEPGEPRPVPVPSPIWGVVAAGADRAFADRSCKP